MQCMYIEYKYIHNTEYIQTCVVIYQIQLKIAIEKTVFPVQPSIRNIFHIQDIPRPGSYIHNTEYIPQNNVKSVHIQT
jgi:hypothetical protein